MNRPFLISRWLALWLSLGLALPNPALALRGGQVGNSQADQKSPQLTGLEEALKNPEGSGLEEDWKDKARRIATIYFWLVGILEKEIEKLPAEQQLNFSDHNLAQVMFLSVNFLEEKKNEDIKNLKYIEDFRNLLFILTGDKTSDVAALKELLSKKSRDKGLYSRKDACEILAVFRSIVTEFSEGRPFSMDGFGINFSLSLSKLPADLRKAAESLGEINFKHLPMLVRRTVKVIGYPYSIAGLPDEPPAEPGPAAESPPAQPPGAGLEETTLEWSPRRQLVERFGEAAVPLNARWAWLMPAREGTTDVHVHIVHESLAGPIAQWIQEQIHTLPQGFEVHTHVLRTDEMIPLETPGVAIKDRLLDLPDFWKEILHKILPVLEVQLGQSIPPLAEMVLYAFQGPGGSVEKVLGVMRLEDSKGQAVYAFFV